MLYILLQVYKTETNLFSIGLLLTILKKKTQTYKKL